MALTMPRKNPDRISTAHLGPFAARLRAVRRAYGASIGRPGLSQAKFAEALGFKDETYRRYERADHEPGLQMLTALRHITGISLCWLVAGAPHGRDDLVPIPATAEGAITLADRLRWTRTLMEPSLNRVAQVMNVDPATWQEIEAGVAKPWFELMEEFAHRFGVSLDFLYLGRLEGISDDVADVLIQSHPELVAAADAARTSTARDAGSSVRAAPIAARRRRRLEPQSVAGPLLGAVSPPGSEPEAETGEEPEPEVDLAALPRPASLAG
jgi:transcriptional regulator with XRE-family HTH domain